MIDTQETVTRLASFLTDAPLCLLICAERRDFVRCKTDGASAILQGGGAEACERQNGLYVKPALLAGSAHNFAAKEEIFGPVPFLLKFF